jgi:predicted nucleic acid-binding protein
VSVTVDTNILVHAANTDDEAYPTARDLLERLARGADLLYLFWPSIVGFLRVSTRPMLFATPYSLAEAIDKVRTPIDRPNVRAPGEQPGFLDLYAATAPHGTRGDTFPTPTSPRSCASTACASSTRATATSGATTGSSRATRSARTEHGCTRRGRPLRTAPFAASIPVAY